METLPRQCLPIDGAPFHAGKTNRVQTPSTANVPGLPRFNAHDSLQLVGRDRSGQAQWVRHRY